MLIKETGEGLPDANSYADIDEADAYFLAREVAEWADATDAAKSAALIRATDFIDANYIFKRVSATSAQALENPRLEEQEIHPRLIRATIELARFALTTDLFKTSPREVAQESTSVGGVSTSTTYRDTNHDPFESITRILAPLATRRGASASSTRLRTS